MPLSVHAGRVTGTWGASGWWSSRRGILGRRAPLSVSAGWGVGRMRGCGQAGGSPGRGQPHTGGMFEMWGNRSRPIQVRAGRGGSGLRALLFRSSRARWKPERGPGSVRRRSRLVRCYRKEAGSCPVADSRLSRASATLRPGHAKPWAPRGKGRWSRSWGGGWCRSSELGSAASKGLLLTSLVSREPGG